jgi:hypothetical protein
MVNTLDYARIKVRSAPVLAAVGGFHLLATCRHDVDEAGAARDGRDDPAHRRADSVWQPSMTQI